MEKGRKRRLNYSKLAVIFIITLFGILIWGLVHLNNKKNEADTVMTNQESKYTGKLQYTSENNAEKKDGKEDLNVGGSKVVKEPEPVKTNSDKKTENKSNTSVKPKDYNVFFKKDVFIGDSITEGISFYDFLPEENVIAKLGLNLMKVDSQIEKAGKLKPERIFLLMGANDLEYEGTTPEIFKGRYKKMIDKINKNIPGAKIYVQSILPVLPEATKRSKLVNNERIKQFNSAIKNMAKEENITYLDIASLLNDSNKKLYEPDGEHFKETFYNLWLNYIEQKIR